MNPLFKHATRAIKDAARREFRSGQVGKLLKEIERVTLRKPGGGQQYMKQVTQKLRGVVPNAEIRKIAQQLAKSREGQQVERYVKKAWQTAAMDSVLGALGPLGDVVKAFLRPTGRALTTSVHRELRAAEELLKGFGFQVIPPPAKRGGLKAQTEATKQYMEALGFKVSAPEVGKLKPLPGWAKFQFEQQKSKQPKEAPGRRTLDIDIGLGRQSRLRLTDPILTGEMIPVVSSNVHSIGFDINQQTPVIGTLKVRYLQEHGAKVRGARVAGAQYEYFNVPTVLFAKFRRASSKGKWVWSNLRIRGTVSGHKFDYRLSGITGGYVPRKATMVAGGDEFYVKRSFFGERNGVKKLFHSGEDMRARYAPNRGEPNRGTPNRGR